MSNISKEQRETLALVDAILALLEKNPTNGGTNITLSANPFDFLIDMISKIVNKKEMIDWLSNMLVKVLPSMELAIKAAILSNLKSTIDCNNDPRIPNWIRMSVNSDDSKNFDKGLKFDVRSLDYTNMLQVSPLTVQGMNLYFGTRTLFEVLGDSELSDIKYSTFKKALNDCKKYGIDITRISNKSEITSVYELARARDFNAFIWFIIHKAKFIKEANKSDLPDDFDILKPFEGKETLGVNDLATIIPGEIVKDGKFFSLCIKSEESNRQETKVLEKDYITKNTSTEEINAGYSTTDYSYKIVPVSINNLSANWYVNSGTFYNFLLPQNKRKERDYSKDYPIFNLQYFDELTYNGKKYYNTLRMMILPKPFVHLPKDNEPAWRIQSILFNENGEPDSKGRFSVKSEDDYDINLETGEYSLKNNDKSKLYECYPKLTVYEFNYDFVMGMQLFDPTVVATKLIEMFTNCFTYGSGVGLDVSINKSETAYQMRISEIVKNIVESTAYEVSDCFYTFDNSKYDSMLNDAELKRSRLYPFNENGNLSATESNTEKSFEILNEFDNNATLQENIDVMTRTITQATANITEEVLPEDKYGIDINIIEGFIKMLVNVTVESLLTPKMILLFETNRQLMGDNNIKLSIEEFLESITGLIVAIVSEIRDLILQQLLDWVMKLLQELFEVIADELLKEQLEYYYRLIKGMLEACWIKASHRSPLDSKLDVVNYADIDLIDKPKENNC